MKFKYPDSLGTQTCYCIRRSYLQQQIDPTSKDMVFLHATATLMVAMSDGTLLWRVCQQIDQFFLMLIAETTFALDSLMVLLNRLHRCSNQSPRCIVRS